jgi:hypothetical protein
MNDFIAIYENVLSELDSAISSQNVVAMPSADDLISICDKVIDELDGYRKARPVVNASD